MSLSVAAPLAAIFADDILRQLKARNAVEVHAFRGITQDYQQCLDQLRDFRVRLATTSCIADLAI